MAADRPVVSTCQASTQTTVSATHLQDYTDDMLLDRPAIKRGLFIKDVLSSDKSAKFYTGKHFLIPTG